MKRIPFRPIRPLLPFFLGLSLLVAGCDFTVLRLPESGEARVTVMTRNLYFGGDLGVLAQATSPLEIPVLAGRLYDAVLASEIPERIRRIAEEIERTKPDLIGLQEVALFRTQTPSDYVTGTTVPNATSVQFDFLALLQAELATRGLRYRVVQEAVNADAELPIRRGATFMDVRLTDRDVILARTGVETSGATSKSFGAKLAFPISGQGGAAILIPRSYGLVRARIDGAAFTFVNTHLETQGSPEVQVAQTTELLQDLAGLDGPVVLVGDFNTAADGSTTGSYALLTDDFADAYAIARPGEAGYTCCQAADLRNPTSTNRARIDLILFRGGLGVETARRTGAEPEERTSSGLWPSDHAGVVATLRFPR